MPGDSAGTALTAGRVTGVNKAGKIVSPVTVIPLSFLPERKENY